MAVSQGTDSPSVPVIQTESVRDFFYIVFRQRYKIAVFFTAVVGATLYTLLQSKPTYTSQARLLLRQGREFVSLDPTADTGKMMSLYPAWESHVNSELEIIRGRETAEKVVEYVGAARILGAEKKPQSGLSERITAFRKRLTMDKDQPPSNPTSVAVELLMKKLNIYVQEKSNILAINYTADTPDTAWDVVRKVIEFYREKHIIVHKTPGAFEFFAKETEDLKKQLDQAEVDLRNFKNLFGIASLKEQQNLLVTRDRDLRTQAENIEVRAASSQTKIETLRNLQARGPGAAREPGATILGIQDQKEIQTAIWQAEAEQASLNTETEKIKVQQAKVEVELKALNDTEVRLTDMERNREIIRGQYQKYMENLEQARVDEALEAKKFSTISVVQDATLPRLPDERQRKLKLLVAVFVGLVGGLGIAFAAAALDHAIYVPEDIERRLGLHCLVSIPKSRDPWTTPAVKITPDRGPIVIDRQNTKKLPAEAAENYEWLCDRVLATLRPSTGEPVVLGVTSTHFGAGVSTIASNLAVTLAHYCNPGGVLYVDANVRIPWQLIADGKPGVPTAVEVRVDSEGQMQAVEQNIMVMTDSERKETSSNVSTRPRYDTLLPMIRKRSYQFVIFDLPPVKEGSSTARLASLTDGVVLVVEAERVRWEVALRTRNSLMAAHANVIGAVLNKRKFYVPTWLYRRI
jgi:uncharacterized protein involved in exopolysaccharide biosynthesis/Mrp family chromosome partitioning ATPase